MFALESAGQFDLARGAIGGALVVSIAYLAGFAIFRRGSAAVCAFLMVATAAALQFSALGLLRVPSPHILVVLQGFFAASALIFLSAVVRVARNNALLGGSMFAVALTIAGFGLITMFAGGDGSGFMRAALLGVGIFGVGLAGSQVLRDHGARLVLPGILIALAAPFSLGFFGGSFAIGPQLLFTLGVVAASLVALTETASPRRRASHIHETPGESIIPHHHAMDHAEKLRVSENELAQVLDYAGISIWDWCPHGSHQTEGLPTLLGADSHGQFSPETMRAFIHKDDVVRFEQKIVGSGESEGGFDSVLKLHDGRHVRFRGARAVDNGGGIERLIAFVESAPDAAKVARAPVAAFAAATPLLAPRAPAVSRDPIAANDAPAFGTIQPVFQPIVSLKDGKVVGYEALARSHGSDGTEFGAEETLRAAAAAGQSGALTDQMLAAAARHLSDNLKSTKGLFVAMNVSYGQISAPGFAETVKKTIKEYGLPHKALVLELTEAEAITDDVGAASSLFRSLRHAGAALAFDDFGAGFTSLGNLHKFSFDYLKIDKSFIDRLASSDGAKIGKSIASLGRELGLVVIAEGIETEEMAEAARAAGCTLGQGYAFGGPVEAPKPDATRASDKSRNRLKSGLR